MQLTFSALALLGLPGLLGLVTARPQHDVHPTLAVDLLQSRSPKAWLQGGLKASKCHDRKVVDSNSILAKGVSSLENEGFGSEPEDISVISPEISDSKKGDVYAVESQLASRKLWQFGPWIPLFQGDKFLQCPKECPIYADDRALALLGLRLIWTNIVYKCHTHTHTHIYIYTHPHERIRQKSVMW